MSSSFQKLQFQIEFLKLQNIHQKKTYFLNVPQSHIYIVSNFFVQLFYKFDILCVSVYFVCTHSEKLKNSFILLHFMSILHYIKSKILRGGTVILRQADGQRISSYFSFLYRKMTETFVNLIIWLSFLKESQQSDNDTSTRK